MLKEDHWFLTSSSHVLKVYSLRPLMPFPEWHFFDHNIPPGPYLRFVMHVATTVREVALKEGKLIYDKYQVWWHFPISPPCCFAKTVPSECHQNWTSWTFINAEGWIFTPLSPRQRQIVQKSTERDSLTLEREVIHLIILQMCSVVYFVFLFSSH